MTEGRAVWYAFLAIAFGMMLFFPVAYILNWIDVGLLLPLQGLVTILVLTLRWTVFHRYRVRGLRSGQPSKG